MFLIVLTWIAKIFGGLVLLMIALIAIDFVQWRRERTRNGKRVEGYLKAEGERP